MTFNQCIKEYRVMKLVKMFATRKEFPVLLAEELPRVSINARSPRILGSDNLTALCLRWVFNFLLATFLPQPPHFAISIQNAFLFHSYRPYIPNHNLHLIIYPLTLSAANPLPPVKASISSSLPANSFTCATVSLHLPN